MHANQYTSQYTIPAKKARPVKIIYAKSFVSVHQDDQTMIDWLL